MVDDGENSFVTHVTTQFISCLLLTTLALTLSNAWYGLFVPYFQSQKLVQSQEGKKSCNKFGETNRRV